MTKFDPSKFFLKKETLSDKLNYTYQDLVSHKVLVHKDLRWFQFGAVALLRIRDIKKDIAFSVMQYENYKKELVYDLAIYEDQRPEELKNRLEKGLGLGEAIYKQYNNFYSLMIEVCKLL